ncbi:protein sprint isoform X5 [Spodoptera litura]|uniref:Protein sprint isoform X5 n=1 Tax=Spodoptera litura TaxID=69820 RepID=A0A9J7E9R5_SPOLT|nr:protein sprint isoform X5 [Spodoptera litura]
MSNICQRYIRRHYEEKAGGSYMKLLNTLSSDLEDMLTELYEENISRNATFLEPHLQGVRRRDSRSSDSDHDERSTEDDERSLLRSSPRTRLPPPPPPPPDDDPPPLKPREFFERLQTQAMREAQERKHRSRDLPIKDSNQLFRPVDADGSLGDSLSQSRESLSSDGEGARGDCSSVDSSGSGSEEQPPCDIGLLERLIRTHPVWFLPGIQRAGAFHLLQGKEEGNFVVRQSSQPDTMAISVRLPADKGPYIEHYLIQASGGRIGLETSHNRFDNIPELIAHYSQCCDELPVQLQLPRPLREAKSRHQLSSLALLGQEFWGYPMANPKNNPNNPLSPCQLANGVVPMAVTPSDTGSSLSSFNASTRTNSREHILSPDKDQNVVLKMSPIDTSGSPPSQNSNLSTFKGKTAPSPPAKPNSAFIRAPRPTPPNTLNLMSSTAHITQPHTFPTTNTQHSPTQLNNVKTTPPPPPPRWAKPPFTKPSLSPKSEAFSPINKVSQNGNITVTTTVTFCVNNTQIHNHQINESIQSDRLQLTLASNAVNNNGSADSVFSIMDATKNIADSNGESQNMMHRMSPEGECINAMTASLHGSFKRQMTEQNNVEPGSPVEQQSQTNTSDSVDPIVNSLTKSGSTFAPNQLVSPNGTNSVTSGIFSPTSQINSPVSNDTISSKSGVFSPMSQTNKSEIFSPISRSSPISAKNVFSPTSNQSIISPVMGKDRDKVMSPNTNTASTTPSGRSRRSKHSHRKESRHYQESDILESPGVYCRSSLMDKVSDYEDIWGPESNSCSTFKPLKPENENNIHNGLMKSKRPDLLPDTLPKLNAAKSTQSILEKENIHLINSTESLNEKKTLSDGSLKKSFKGSSEIIATTNSKGEIIPKRPDRLNIAMNMNKKLTEEIEAVVKNRENYSIESMETIKIEDENVLNSMGEESEKDNAGSPFYADPVDALKEAALPQVQRRKLLRVGMNLSQRYSEPPIQNHPYYPLRDMHSIEELSPSSPNTSSSVDNLMSLRSKPKMKPVQPPRIANKPPSGKNDQTWTVDSSWEFINKNDEGANSESGTFPSLAEQECRLSAVDDGTQHLTVHQVVAQRLPDLRLNAEPTMLPEEVRSPPRASCYDNVHDLRPLSEQASDDGTVFSEPWDSSQWDGLIPPSNGHQLYDTEEPCEWESPIPRRGPTVATRAKSFRDRLDPLLAAGRVRALRGGRQTRGAGAALRAYALHLAQDKSTTFAQNIDNFIACTLDSKDTSPQVMMRNMRQFMSGMKNYLVKHGEREFEKEVEKERLKLKPTEFLNLDAILEGVMHRLVVRPLRARLYTLLAAWHSADVRRLHAAIERAQHATPLQLGIKESTKVPSSAVLAVISKHFLKMQEADSPLDKLENLLAAISVMFNAIRGERSVGADDLLPVLAWTIARSRLVCAELEAELMAGLLPAALLAGEGGYYLTAMFSAVAVLKRLAPEPQPDSTTPQWRRGSVDNNREQHSVAVVRVVLPDECRGSIRRVPVPCRPGARARDLCRALAHAAAITNPQDYALFALHDGHETMLNENDCPQEVMSEKTGQNFTLAYRRIDAKIAWPQQALLSYP